MESSLCGWDDDEFEDSDQDDETGGRDNQVKKDEYLSAEDTDNYLDEHELDKNLNLSQKQKQLNESNQANNRDGKQAETRNNPSSMEITAGNEDDDKHDIYLDLGDVENMDT